MAAIEYLDPSIANEGVHVDKWNPGAWANTVGDDEEWQPDVEPPRITDYAAFKKHKHYGQYFKPYRYRPFPAWMYHATEEPRIVKSKEEVIALGPAWSPVPNKPRIDMTGKSIPGKSQTERLGEIIAESLATKSTGAGAVDPTAIAAIVAAVMAALPQNQPAAAAVVASVPVDPPSDVEGLRAFAEKASDGDDEHPGHGSIERKALIELAEKEGVKIDGRWSNDRIKKELGL